MADSDSSPPLPKAAPLSLVKSLSLSLSLSVVFYLFIFTVLTFDDLWFLLAAKEGEHSSDWHKDRGKIFLFLFLNC